MVQVAHGVTLSPRILGRLARYLLSNLPFLWPGRLCEGRPGEDEDSDFPLASLVLLAVDPAHHRRGIASSLTDAFLADMAERSVKRIKVVVGAANRATSIASDLRGVLDHRDPRHSPQVAVEGYHLSLPTGGSQRRHIAVGEVEASKVPIPGQGLR